MKTPLTEIETKYDNKDKPNIKNLLLNRIKGLNKKNGIFLSNKWNLHLIRCHLDGIIFVL